MKIFKQTILFSLTAALLLTITGCSSSDGNSTSSIGAPLYVPAGWFMKTGVTATAGDGTLYNHTTAGVFGELLQSSDGKDRNDVPGYGTAILQVVFTQTGWDEGNGDYFSDYRAWDETNVSKKSWTFQVKNQHTVNLANAPISITLDGAYNVSYTDDENGGTYYKISPTPDNVKRASVTLVDVDNNTTYTSEQLTSASLFMDGLHTRTFRWVLGEVSAEDRQPLASPARSAAFKNTAEEFQEAGDTVDGKWAPPSF